MNALGGTAETIGQWSAGGFGAGLSFFVVRWVAVFMAGRWDKREAQIDEATKRLIEQLTREVNRLAERLAVVEHDLEECKKHRDELAAERARWRGYSQGAGDARQQAARIVAEEKITERAQRKDAG